ncbi:MAG: helix-turn-helix domain-containing protein [Turicibacter sp.]|nr:helix-turn-helix domain-containing protein [Turicibacter sp.]
MLTEFGKRLRIMRINRGDILKDMADKLGMSSAYLSAIETGRRNVPEDLVERVSEMYSLDVTEYRELKDLTDRAIKNINVNIGNADTARRNAALIFARNFNDMDKETAQKLVKILNKKEE